MGKRFGNVGAALDYAAMILVLSALIIFFGFKSPTFLAWDNFLSIANQLPALMLLATGMTFVLIIAGIDLSVGSILGVSGAVLALCIDKFSLPLPLAVLAAVGAGLACGLVNGVVSVRWAVPSFIVTLGMLEIGRGATFMLTDTRTVYLGADKIGFLARSAPGTLSGLFLAALVVVILGQVLLTKTVFGRLMIAVGTNEEAVRLSGIKTWPVKVAVFTISGFMCALGAVVVTARMGSANPNAGTGMELEAIAAVVIGGTSLMGGRGSVVKSFFGVAIMAVLSSGLAQIGTAEPAKRLITGCVIVLAVILDHYRSKLTGGKAVSLGKLVKRTP